MRGLDQLRTQLADLRSQRPALSEELDRQREDYLARKAMVERLQAAISDRVSVVSTLVSVLAKAPDAGKVPAEIRELGLPEATEISTRLDAFRKFLLDLRRNIEPLASEDFDQPLAAITEEFEKRNQLYYQ